ncbi:hypothetical protein [Faecalibacillus intestinalis]|uniref:hypothetical protein n=1 Tax=Faecalibacillus intestinalis TaxID=1982626 RepID=UPI00295EB57E|nr:hypothetical protein [Faecalibacillus intestinalis]
MFDPIYINDGNERNFGDFLFLFKLGCFFRELEVDKLEEPLLILKFERGQQWKTW